jgi:hypothetical protein
MSSVAFTWSQITSGMSLLVPLTSPANGSSHLELSDLILVIATGHILSKKAPLESRCTIKWTFLQLLCPS